jgi:hypothetical protein
MRAGWRRKAALWLASAAVAGAAEPRVGLTANGALLVDGKPFLPLFAWAQPSRRLSFFKALNCNTFHVGEKEELDPLPALLDKALAAGMMVLAGEERYREAARGHPAVLAWTVEHEPDMARTLPYRADVPEDAVWLEGEQPLASTFNANPWLDKEHDLLSGKRWLSADGTGQGEARYSFRLQRGGRYNLFVREFNKRWANPTIWKVDDAPPRETPRTLESAETMDLGANRGVGWAHYGALQLETGTHSLTLAVAPGRTLGDPAKPPAPEAVWAVDAVCLTPGDSFPPARTGYAPTRPPEVCKAAFERMRQRDPNALTWIILTGQFHKNYNKLPLTLYDEYLRHADIVAFDHYPVTGWNKPRRLPEVGSMTRQLRRMARPNQPVWTIVEASDQELPWTAPETRGPTAAEVRAEAWMSIAAGARGIGYFTISFGRGKQFKWHHLAEDVKTEIRRTNGELQELAAPIVLGDTTKKLAVTGDECDDPAAEGHAVLAIRKEHEGAVWIIAVNTTRQPARPRFAMEEAPPGNVRVWKENRLIGQENGTFVDELAPLAVRVYVVDGS